MFPAVAVIEKSDRLIITKEMVNNREVNNKALPTASKVRFNAARELSPYLRWEA